jgi:hypothetical protein
MLQADVGNVALESRNTTGDQSIRSCEARTHRRFNQLQRALGRLVRA